MCIANENSFFFHRNKGALIGMLEVKGLDQHSQIEYPKQEVFNILTKTNKD